MKLRELTPLEQAENELNKRRLKTGQMRREMLNFDKKLNKLSDEMLYYVFNKAGQIIERRMEEAR